VPSLVDRPRGCEFHTRCPEAKDRCRSEFPELVADSEGHQYHCFFPMKE